MSIASTLNALASYAPLEGTALPWPSDPMVSDGYVDVLQSAFDAYFKEVVFELDIPELAFETNAALALSAYEELEALVADRADAVFQAIAAGKPHVAMQEAVMVPVPTLRTVLVVINAVAWASFQAHESGAWRWAVANRVASAPELKDSAETVYRLWALVRKLKALGALDALKKPQFKGTQGLGIAWPVAAVIAIAAVAAIAIIAWLVITLKVESNRVGAIEKTCLDSNGRLLKDAPPHCAKYFNAIAQDPNGHLSTLFAPVTEALAAALKTLATIAGIGALVYVGVVYAVPAVTKAWGRRAEAT